MAERDRGRKRRGVPPWLARGGRGIKAGVAKLRAPMSIAKQIAGNPAALAVLMSAMVAAGGLAYTEARTNPIESDVADIAGTISDAERIVAEMSGEVVELRTEADSLVAEVGRLAEAVAAGDEALADDIAQEVGRRSATLRQQAEQLSAMAEDLSTLDRHPIGAEVVDVLADDVADLAEQLDSTATTLSALSGDVEGVRAELAEAGGDLATVAEQVEQVESELARTNEAVTALAADLDAVAQRVVDAEVAAAVADEKATTALDGLPVAGVVSARTTTGPPRPPQPPASQPGTGEAKTLVLPASQSQFYRVLRIAGPSSCSITFLIDGVERNPLNVAGGSITYEYSGFAPGEHTIQMKVTPPNESATCSSEATILFLPVPRS